IDCRHVRSPLPVIRGSSRARRQRAARGGAAHGARAARPDRLYQAALRSASERIRAGERAAPRLAHRLHRLGRQRRRAHGARRALRRRALHAAGARAGGHLAVCNRTSDGDAAASLDRGESRGRRPARLRSLAAHGGTPGAAGQSPRGPPREADLDRAPAADALSRLVTSHGGKVTRGACPIALMKAVKNEVEIAGARAAHVRDGAAVTRFLAWFDREAGGGKLTEIDAVAALESFRRETGLLKDISFPTIAAAGPDGAIVHYRVTRESNRVIAPGELFLIDSGAQYEDGTTDVTRTVVVGDPTLEMRGRFTRVLKGHIALARAIFPAGTTGAQLDSFARQFLWARGLDFDHGTGHGVGSYLSVHEGPARISKLGTAALEPGMILSNEPGYYKSGAYGIRIENLVLVVRAAPVAGAEKPLNAFETLTLAPIDRRLIVAEMLTAEESAWLDAYHARVLETLSPLVDSDTRTWLAAAARPLGRR